MELLSSFLVALNPSNLLFAFIGVLVGMVVGILPGLTSTMTLALFTPFAFVLNPFQGLALMLGVYNATMFGGDITAILINTPGTPASIVTTFDGYPMARQGKAGLALGLNAIAGAFGTLFGLAVLAVVALPLAQLALRFNSPEYFSLAIFGLSMMVSVSGKSLIKGLLVGILGLLVSVVGLDPVSGFPRFTFGNLGLLSGVSFVPFMIGLFGFSEVADQMLQRAEQLALTTTEGFGRIWPTRAETKRIGIPMFLAGIIGVFIGALPGAGGDIASLISWDQSRRLSKHPEEFGKGSVEGLAAALTANNSVIGGTLATMLTLGIPGDANTAVLIGTLLMWGLQPGPLFFRDHLDLFYLIIGTLAVSTIMSFVVSVARIRTLAEWVAKMPKRYLWPLILLLCIVGSYALNNSVQDIWVMLISGFVGLILRRLDFPLGPIVLGVILGPMAEANLRRAMTISHGSWAIMVTEPISLLLLVLSVLAVVTSLWSRKRNTEISRIMAASGD